MSEINWHKSQPGPVRLGKVVKTNFPVIRTIGIYNDRLVAGTTKKSSHAEGRAIDIHLNVHNPGQKMIADLLFRAIQESARADGIDNVIWNRRIWSVSHGGPRPYHGENPHRDHVHVEFTRAGSQAAVLGTLERKIAIIRQGLEEVAQANANIA